MLFRPPEYLEDVRERELEIKAMEERLAKRDLHCPVCRAEVDSSFLVCPVCTTKLKQACVNCKAPLEALWQVCPYCETPVEPTAVDAAALVEARPRRGDARAARVDCCRADGRRAHTHPDQAGRRPARASPARSSARIEARGFTSARASS